MRSLKRIGHAARGPALAATIVLTVHVYPVESGQQLTYTSSHIYS